MICRLVLLFLFAAASAEAGTYKDYHIQLKHKENKCMTFDPKDGYSIKLANCKDSSMQAWYYVDGQVKSKHSSYKDWCVTMDLSKRGRFLKLSPCNANDKKQLWDYDRYLLKNRHNGYCMDSCNCRGGKVHTKTCRRDYRVDQHYLLGPKCYTEPETKEPSEEDYWSQFIPEDAWDGLDEHTYEDPEPSDGKEPSDPNDEWGWYFVPPGYNY